ncbi:hypothetical protein B0T26DRAFT_741600 [Lasiosphaeria miniovina]|uniref:Uncharacterized protein n=1 Tax=Lasiosphaeria miniovina TaxID=1954250 RepID=A0AA40AAU6_9PEZI|nr:uncharacterized protein B0T26DRAFT_741600 [Lasiosphaeria miniovina]KAK0712478.1 hypothetical protein B0T26DRAFT_741600 [Lasiosphaeria miniovina]
MKSFAILAAALLGSAVSAAPVEPRVVAQEFDVTGFSAGCVPHGTQCSIGFQVASNETPFPTTCTFTGAPLGVGSLPDVGFTACADPSVAWSFRAVPVGSGAAPFYELALATAEQSLAAAKFFPASDFPIVNDGSSFHQTYTGAGSFVVA